MCYDLIRVRMVWENWIMNSCDFVGIDDECYMFGEVFVVGFEGW